MSNEFPTIPADLIPSDGRFGCGPSKVRVEQLQTIDGVGLVMAERIFTWRQEHGRFTSVDELQEIDGIGPKKFAKLKDRVRVQP